MVDLLLIIEIGAILFIGGLGGLFIRLWDMIKNDYNHFAVKTDGLETRIIDLEDNLEKLKKKKRNGNHKKKNNKTKVKNN